MNRIPNKTDKDFICVYTNYESQSKDSYDVLLGCRVNSLEDIPEGLFGQSFNGGFYQQFIAKGDVTQGQAVRDTWDAIWKSNISRTFTADFEVYGERAQNPNDAEVDIFVAIQQ